MINLKTAYIEIVNRSWWVALFFLVCYIFFEQGMRTRNRDYRMLSEQLAIIQQETKKAVLVQDDLLRKVNSQSDPAWVELTLMKGLGLVPEGQTKVLFAPVKQ